MGVRRHDLETVRAFAAPQPPFPHAPARHPYRASGLVHRPKAVLRPTVGTPSHRLNCFTSIQAHFAAAHRFRARDRADGSRSCALAASPEAAYLAARNKAIAEIKALEQLKVSESAIQAAKDKAVADLEKRLRDIVGPVAVKGFPPPTS